MEETARSILETFDRLGLTRLQAADFPPAARAGANDAALAELVSDGCLREVAGAYERTEWGRLEVAAPLELTLLSLPGCHLCQDALRRIEPLVTKFGARLRIVDIDADRVLWDRYHNDIPVLFLGSRELARHRVDPGQLRTELARAARAS